MLAGIVLAAGPGALLEPPLEAMAAAGLDRVLAVVAPGAGEARARVDLHGAEPVVCERWEEGQSACLAAGLALVTDADAVVVTLGDQPEVPAEAIRRIVAARGEGATAVRATYDGDPDYPLLLEREVLARLRDVTGDRGARNVLMSVPTRQVPCDDLRARAASRGARGGSPGRSRAASGSRDT